MAVAAEASSAASLAGKSGPAASAFTTTDPELIQLARALRHDPDLIFEYVYNTIQTLPIYGSLKGPLGALLDGSGTCFDQAELMAVLLQLSGFSPTFVVGKINRTGEQLERWLDASRDYKVVGNEPNRFIVGSIINAIGNGGFPTDPYERTGVDTGIITQGRIGWAWIKVAISGTEYVFDPATKQYEPPRTATNLATTMKYVSADFFADAQSGMTTVSNGFRNLNRLKIREYIARCAKNLIENVGSNGLEDIVGGPWFKPRPINDPERETSLSYAVAGSTVDYPVVPLEFRSKLVVIIPTELDPLEVTLYSADIYGRRLSLFFNSATQPILALDGVPKATGAAQAPGSRVAIGFRITHPYPTNFADQPRVGDPDQPPQVTQEVTASPGGAFVISNGWGPVGRGTIERQRRVFAANAAADAALPTPNPIAEPVLGQSLLMLGSTWLAQHSRAIGLIERVGNSTVNYHHGVGIVGMSAPEPPANLTGPYVDLPFNVYTVVQRRSRPAGLTSTSQVERAAFFTTIQTSSVLESGSIEQTQPGIPAVSTVKLLDVANPTQNIYNITTTAIFDNVRAQLQNYAPQTLDKLRARVAQGFRLILHRDGRTTVNLWKGFGHFEISPGNNVIGSIISGGYNGGFPTENQPPAQVNINAGREFLPSSLSPANTTPGGFQRGDSYGVLPQGGDPINLVTGGYIYSADDVTMGNGAFPYTLAFQRSYDSGRAGAGSAFGQGWRHGFDLTVARDSDGFEGMGAVSARNGAISIAALYAMFDVQNTAGTSLISSRIVTASLVAQYWMEMLTGNVRRVSRPGAVEGFVRLADGSWSAPPGSNSTLAVNGDGSHTLVTGEGAALQFTAATFSQPGRTTSWASAAGAQVSFGYDASNRLATVSSNLGRTLTLAYTGDLLTSVSDGNGRSVGYAYLPAQTGVPRRLERVTDPLGKQTRFTYDAGGRLQSIFYPAFPNDAFVTNTYDDLGQVTEQRDGNNNLTTVYVAGRRTELAEPSGNRHVWYFDPLGKPVLEVQDFGFKDDGTARGNFATATAYDGQSRPIRVVWPDENAVETTYNEYSNPTKIEQIDKAGSGRLTQTFEYEAPVSAPPNFQRVKKFTDARLNVTEYEYTPVKGTLSKVKQPAVTEPGDPSSVHPETTYAYTAVGLLERETDPKGRITTYGYDTVGNLTAQTVDFGTGRLNLRTTWTYDAVGNALTTVTPRGNLTGADPAAFTTTFTYDGKRRRTLAIPGVGGRTDYVYDDDDRIIQLRRLVKPSDGVNPAVLQRTITSYTKTGKVFRVTDANGVRVTYAYDEADRVKSATSSSGRIVAYGYDMLSRVFAITDLTLSTLDPTIVSRGTVVREQRTFTRNGQLASVTDGEDNRTRFIYDGFDRLFRIDYPDTTREERFLYDANGNMTQRRSRAGLAIDVTYDELNRVLTRSVPGNANAPAVNYAHGYDLSGRLLQLGQSGDAAPITYGYDGAGRLTSETDAAGRLLTYALDADGNRTGLTWPGTGGQATFEYDGASRMTRVREASQQIVVYTYDLVSRQSAAFYANGVVTDWTWRLNSTLERVAHTLPAGAGVVAFDYRYNTENAVSARLVSDATYLPGPGNPALAPGVRSYAVNGLNQYTSVAGVPYSYDDDGNLTGDGVWTYGHDAQGRLVSATKPGTTIGFGYDAAGRRRSRTLNGAVTQVLWAGEQEAAEYDGAGALQRRFVWGSLGPDEILAVIGVTGSLSARRRFHHADGLGSTVALTNNVGVVLEKHAYTPYGVGNANAGTPWRYTGRRLDAETGLYHLRARDYSPLLGRFIQPDPIGIAGGINLYAYVENDPLNATDPSGLVAPFLLLGLGAGLGLGVDIIFNRGVYAGLSGWQRAIRGGIAAGTGALGAGVGLGLVAAGARVAALRTGAGGAATELASGSIGAAVGNAAQQGLQVVAGLREEVSGAEIAAAAALGFLASGVPAIVRGLGAVQPPQTPAGRALDAVSQARGALFGGIAEAAVQRK
jgi:RHS repeat-associated protein